MEVHPVADLFPTLADDELAELAADIKQRGLLQPIVLDPDGRVLDGRNRLAACERAGVKPRFETYAGEDPDGYALAVNIARRHLSTGARAVIAAKAARLNGYGSASKIATFTDLQNSRISEAALVLDWCDAMVIKDVLAGTKPLSKAVEEARQLKREDADREAKKARLREAAPDLLARVGEGMDLAEALGALEVREQRARQEEAERQAREREELATAERLASLPADLAERVKAGNLDFAQAESVVRERAERLAAWVEKVRAGLETFTRMVGNPLPADLKEHLTNQEVAALTVVIGALENGEQQ